MKKEENWAIVTPETVWPGFSSKKAAQTELDRDKDYYKDGQVKELSSIKKK
ncbi:hypothetical protein K8R32_03050 [bacterium]|nr:hypothetical protein [bacterium]